MDGIYCPPELAVKSSADHRAALTTERKNDIEASSKQVFAFAFLYRRRDNSPDLHKRRYPSGKLTFNLSGIRGAQSMLGSSLK
ncbi:hypothetical protein [Acidocella aquatica]|uniref:hypothetical protein n=1 Tax=Acidocella aquatica TaxID=1922313 RepID=UPI0024E07D3E|nr:hypothetical protein [Acidocella aquatica]